LSTKACRRATSLCEDQRAICAICVHVVAAQCHIVFEHTEGIRLRNQITQGFIRKWISLIYAPVRAGDTYPRSHSARPNSCPMLRTFQRCGSELLDIENVLFPFRSRACFDEIISGYNKLRISRLEALYAVSQASSKLMPSMCCKRSIRAGGWPIWKPVSSINQRLRPARGAPYWASARKRFAVLFVDRMNRLDLSLLVFCVNAEKRNPHHKLLNGVIVEGA